MKSIPKKDLFHLPPKQDIYLLAGFYFFWSVAYHLATWTNYGGFDSKSNVPTWSFQEFLASAGLNFLITFLVSILIWFLIFRIGKQLNIRKLLFAHSFLLIFFLFAVGWIQSIAIPFFGWAEFFGGKSTVWKYYFLGLFYVVQFGSMHAYSYHKKYKTELERQAELKQLALKSELSALKAQLNPHFLYNVFNSINASIPIEHEETRELIVQLSELFRYQNQASKADLVPLSDEIQFLRNYLALEKQRLKNRLRVHFEIQSGTLAKKIPPMLLQPLVENAIVHGIAPKIEGGEIIISIEQKSDILYFEIADTGMGISNISELFNKGLGLKNTKLRLEKRYRSELQITKNQPSGVRISFKINTQIQ